MSKLFSFIFMAQGLNVLGNLQKLSERLECPHRHNFFLVKMPWRIFSHFSEVLRSIMTTSTKGVQHKTETDIISLPHLETFI